MESRTIKAVYTIVDKGNDKSLWLRIGWAYTNRDGSINIKLDALPMNGSLNVRDYVPREDSPSRNGHHDEPSGASSVIKMRNKPAQEHAPSLNDL